MLYQGSYLNGFAPRDFEPAYPELWRGCVGAWCPSLGPTGAVLRDWSGRQNHGTITNATLDTAWANSQGYCLSFDGTDDCIDVGDVAVADFGTSDFTVSFWVKWTDTAAGLFISKSDYIGSDNGIYIYQQLGQAGKIAVYDGVTETFSSQSGLNDGNWHHVAVVREGTGAGQGKIYVDATLSANTFTDSRTLANSKSFRINGSAESFAASFIACSMDDVRLYGRAVSMSEASLLYFNGRGRGIAYSFNQPRGSLTAGESSGSSGSTFPGLAWRALRRWRFVVRAGVDGNWPRVT